MTKFDDAVNDLKNADNSVADAFTDLAGSLTEAQEFINGSQTPSTLGYGTRQSKLQNNRQAVSTRNVIHWVVPEGPIIQMYINPQSLTITSGKDIQSTRTKGGYVMQYFGPKLFTLRIAGNTGTSGIEGINVLYDLYRYEQLAFDPYALYMAADNYDKTYSSNIFGEDSALSAGDEFVSSLLGQSAAPLTNINPPSLADIAFRVEMFYAGEVFRGYFTDFTVTEQAENLGIFSYDMNFTVTQRRGFRQNFFAWHRSANDGPSQTDPATGVPYSYSSLISR